MWGAVAWEKSPVRPGHPKSRSHQANAYDRRSSGHFEYAAEPGRPLGRRSLQREKWQDLHRSNEDAKSQNATDRRVRT